MKSLSPSENTHLLGLRIRGVQHESQLLAVERLRKLGVPENLISDAVMATTQEEMDAADEAIIQWTSDAYGQSQESALLILNGASPVQEV